MDHAGLVTHYDSLKIARNAPAEVIRAAYRALAQQFHPDKFPDRALAEHRMRVINKAYEVLSDPDQRCEHDAWISRQEALIAAAQRGESRKSQADDAARIRYGRASGENVYAGGEIPSSGYRTGILIRPRKKTFLGSAFRFIRGCIYSLVVVVAIGFVIFLFNDNPNSFTHYAERIFKAVGLGTLAGKNGGTTQSGILPAQLTITSPQYDIDANEFTGKLANNSELPLRNFTVSIQVLDCATSCEVVAIHVLTVNARVPPGQSADFNTFGKPANAPPAEDAPVNHGGRQYRWEIISAAEDL